MDWHKLETFSFGDSSKLADELLALVLEGKKRAPAVGPSAKASKARRSPNPW